MSDKTWTSGTVIDSPWLTDVNALTYRVNQGGTGAVNRTGFSKLLDKVNLLEYGAVYGGAVDASTALTNALAAATEVEITGQILLNSQVIIPTNKRITMLRDGGILVNMTTFTGANTSSTGCALVFSSATGSQQSLTGGYIRPNTYTDSRLCIAIRILSSTHVTISNVNFNNWSQADGIINVDSSTDVVITNCKFRDSSTTVGQLTGIVVDNNIVGGVASKRVRITNNDFYNLRGLNQGAANEQSDGITLARTVEEFIIANNTFETIGEPIDCFGIHGNISNNVINDAINYGIKLVHGASRVVVNGNHIRNSGIAGIVLSVPNGAVGETVTQLEIFGNNIQGINARGYYSGVDTACIYLDEGDGLGGSRIEYNNIHNNFLNPAGGKYCIDKVRVLSGIQNWFMDNFFVGPGSVSIVHNNVYSNAGRITATNCSNVRTYMGTTQNILSGATDKVKFDTESYDDLNEFDPGVGNNRWQMRSTPGLYRFHAQIKLGSITTAGSIITLTLRKNGVTTVASVPLDGRSNTSYALDATLEVAEGDYYEIFLANGDTGTVVVQSGTDISHFTVEPA